MLMYELEKPLSNEYTGNELAVIGMAGRFQGLEILTRTGRICVKRSIQ